MKTIRIAALVVLGAAVVALGGVGRPDTAGGASKPDAGIIVHGTGTVKAVPDEAEFSLAVQTGGGTAREALAANSERMRRVLAAVRSAGVAKGDIQTQEVSISQSYDGNGHPNGYSARNSVSIKIHPLAKAGSVLDAATNAGANDVYGPTLSRSDREQLQGDALRSAVENARAKAKALADAAGVQLGDVTAITENSSGIPEQYFDFAPLRAARSSTPISPGKEDIQASVTVTFSIG